MNCHVNAGSPTVVLYRSSQYPSPLSAFQPFCFFLWGRGCSCLKTRCNGAQVALSSWFLCFHFPDADVHLHAWYLWWSLYRESFVTFLFVCSFFSAFLVDIAEQGDMKQHLTVVLSLALCAWMCLCMYIYAVWVQYAQRPQEGVRSAAGIQAVVSHLTWEVDSDPLQGQQEFLLLSHVSRPQ